MCSAHEEYEGRNNWTATINKVTTIRVNLIRVEISEELLSSSLTRTTPFGYRQASLTEVTST